MQCRVCLASWILLVEPQVGVPQVQINMDRQAAAAVGLTAKQPAET